MAIYFYTSTDKYGALSNFARYGFELDGKYWHSVEHYFQAQKFPATQWAEKIRKALTPKEAKQLGRTRTLPIRSDWEQVKDNVMRRAIWQKFISHPELKELLLSTGDEELIENSPNDYYWGCGADGSGKNMTGVLLMEIRLALKQQ
ncbi:MAG: NADAR family protein [Acidobacteriota bacterium]